MKSGRHTRQTSIRGTAEQAGEEDAVEAEEEVAGAEDGEAELEEEAEEPSEDEDF